MNVSTVWCQEACWVTGFSETGGTNTCYTRVCVFPETRWSGAVRSPQGENIAFEAEVPIFVQPAAGGKKLEVFRYEKWSKRLQEKPSCHWNLISLLFSVVSCAPLDLFQMFPVVTCESSSELKCHIHISCNNSYTKLVLNYTKLAKLHFYFSLMSSNYFPFLLYFKSLFSYLVN